METLSKEEKSHLNQLVRDLVQGEANLKNDNDGFDQIPYIVKQVFQASRHDVFGEILSGFIGKKELEIEKMCGLHYQEFVQSVDQLLKVRAGTNTIKDKIVTMNSNIQSFGSRLVEKQGDLVDNRRKLLNIEITLEAVQSCLFVLDIINRISVQIVNKKYFSALRMIQEIQQSHLKLIRGYSFAKLISDWLPQVQDAIRESVLRDLKDWFSVIREGAHKIGKMALELSSLRQEKANQLMESHQSLHTSNRSLNLTASMEMAMNEEYNLEGLEAGEAQIDFTPLFQCIHIHDVLNKRVQLKLEFDESRRLQAEVILHSSIPSLKHDDMSGLVRYIQEIAGFFVIEATVISTTQDFRSRSSVETLWQTATNKMNAHLYEALTECTNPDLYLRIKLLVNSFIQTMEVYGYAVVSLTDLMVSLLDRYAELMKNKCAALILKTTEEEDDYMPLVVKDSDELDEILSVYKIPEDILKQNVSKRDSSIIFPKVLPFSRGVPQACKYIREFVYGFYKFADGFSQQSYEIDDLLKKTIENLLLSVNSTFRDKIATAGISVVYQLTINIQYFQKACTDFEELLMERRYSIRTMRVTLVAAKSFGETKAMAEQRIYAIINAKNDSFLELIDYEWSTSVPRRQASPYLNDLVAYLTTVMTSTLAEFPTKSKGLIYFEAFDHLASSIKAMMLSPSVQHISLAALETIEYDVCYLETCCKKLQESHAQDSFVEIKQLIAFGRSEKYDDFMTVKAKKYARVELQDAIILLEKMRNIDTSWFSQASAYDKQLKANIEGAMKLLRNKT